MEIDSPLLSTLSFQWKSIEEEDVYFAYERMTSSSGMGEKEKEKVEIVDITEC